MSLGLFNCRLIHGAGEQLFFFAMGSQLAPPSLRFLVSRICWKVGAVSRARVFCAAQRTLDAAPSFHTISLESEGKKTLKGRGLVRFMRGFTHKLCYRADISINKNILFESLLVINPLALD